MVVEDNSLSIYPGVFTNVVDSGLPVFNQLHNIGSELSQVFNRLENGLEFIFPAFPSLLF